MYSNRYIDKNDKLQKSERRRIRTNPTANAENIQFKIKSAKQQNEQTNSSSSKPKKKGGKNKNTGNKQEQLKFKQNSENRQKRWRGKTIEHNEKSDNGNTEKNKITKYSFGIQRLADLCCKDPSEIVFVMSNKVNGFMELFKQNKEPDWIFLF